MGSKIRFVRGEVRSWPMARLPRSVGVWRAGYLRRMSQSRIAKSLARRARLVAIRDKMVIGTADMEEAQEYLRVRVFDGFPITATEIEARQAAGFGAG